MIRSKIPLDFGCQAKSYDAVAEVRVGVAVVSPVVMLISRIVFAKANSADKCICVHRSTVYSPKTVHEKEKESILCRLTDHTNKYKRIFLSRRKAKHESTTRNCVLLFDRSNGDYASSRPP